MTNVYAPILDASKIVTLDAIAEDAGPPVGAVGTLVSSLVDLNPPAGGANNVTDADSGSVTGLALTSIDATSGTWFFTIDGGSNWTAVGAVSEASALLLAANADTRLYFQPNADFNGTVTNAISFLAWDQTSGTNGGIADVTTNGGSTAFSSSGPPANVLVNGLGGVAGFGENSLAVEDEAQQVVSLTSIFGSEGINFFGTHFTDITIDNNGIVYFGSGLSVTANREDYAYYDSSSGPSVSSTSGPLASWQVGPISADLSAAIAVFWADVDTRAITALSPGGNSTGSNRVYWDLDTTNATLTVTWYDAGSFDQNSVPNAFQLQLIAGSNGDFDIVFRYEAVTWTRGDGYSAGFDAPAGFSTGNSSFFRLPSSGYAAAVADLDTDEGNTGGAGVWEWHVRDGVVTDRTHVGTAVITVDAVNDDPTGAPTAVLAAGTEDTSYTVSAADLLAGFSDVDGDTLAVANLGAFNGSVADNGDGTFTVTPSPNFNGAVTLIYDVLDGNGGSVSGVTQSYTVTPVNDAPTGTPIAVLAAGTEDTSYIISAADLVADFTDVDGDTFTVANLGADNGSAADNGDGTFTVTPSLNFNGAVTLTYDVLDSHGAALADVTHSYTVTPVNDAPETSAGSATTDNDIAVQIALAGSDLEGTVAAFRVTSAPHGTFWDAATGGSQLDPDSLPTSGSIWFLPEFDFSGTTSFQFAAVDNQGLEDPTPATFTIDVLRASHITDFPDGSRKIQYWDVHHQRDWSDYVANYDDQGRLTEEILDYDDGSRRTVDYDAANQFNWSDVTTNFNNQGAQTIQAVNYDDASRQVFLTGGAGPDTFVFRPGFGNNVITNFTVDGVDHDFLELEHDMFSHFATVEDLLASAQVAQVGANVVITHDASDTLTLQNVSLTTLRAHADDFSFV